MTDALKHFFDVAHVPSPDGLEGLVWLEAKVLVPTGLTLMSRDELDNNLSGQRDIGVPVPHCHKNAAWRLLYSGGVMYTKCDECGKDGRPFPVAFK